MAKARTKTASLIQKALPATTTTGKFQSSCPRTAWDQMPAGKKHMVLSVSCRILQWPDIGSTSSRGSPRPRENLPGGVDRIYDRMEMLWARSEGHACMTHRFDMIITDDSRWVAGFVKFSEQAARGAGRHVAEERRCC